jgi:hypothetical protein
VVGWGWDVIGFEKISDVGTDMVDSMTPPQRTNERMLMMMMPKAISFLDQTNYTQGPYWNFLYFLFLILYTTTKLVELQEEEEERTISQGVGVGCLESTN